MSPAHRRHGFQIPGLITAGIALTLAVIMAAVTVASSARQNGTAMNRLRIIAYVLSCLEFVALLIAICIMLASLRNKQTNILLAVLAFLTLVVVLMCFSASYRVAVIAGVIWLAILFAAYQLTQAKK